MQFRLGREFLQQSDGTGPLPVSRNEACRGGHAAEALYASAIRAIDSNAVSVRFPTH